MVKRLEQVTAAKGMWVLALIVLVTLGIGLTSEISQAIGETGENGILYLSLAVFAGLCVLSVRKLGLHIDEEAELARKLAPYKVNTKVHDSKSSKG